MPGQAAESQVAELWDLALACPASTEQGRPSQIHCPFTGPNFRLVPHPALCP